MPPRRTDPPCARCCDWRAAVRFTSSCRPARRRSPWRIAPSRSSGTSWAVAAELEKTGASALPVHLDVTDGASCRGAVAAAVERFGGVDVLMYGAADSDRMATVLEMEEAAWERVIRINLTGAFLMAKAALPAMIARGGGSVILIASQLG